ncbi:MAG TPA: DUF3995 domain-containing protein [Chryseolinea sp.]|nr:DUF3995 domain-containing protein [Chitinophagaceae bacterium]HPM29546.1 DUF3995 domain-containing protein [Chryseolinea sp.]
MLLILVAINTIIFLTLSGIHFYWMSGGKRGSVSALPSNPSTQELLFKPSIMATLIVAGGLLLFAIITLGNLISFPFNIDQRYFHWGNLAISVIFFIRAIGDFKYIGFFKNIKETLFAKMDSKFYSPLCLTISAIGLAIFFLTFSDS